MCLLNLLFGKTPKLATVGIISEGGQVVMKYSEAVSGGAKKIDNTVSGAKFLDQVSVQKFFKSLNAKKQTEFLADFGDNALALKKLEESPELLKIWRDELRSGNIEELQNFVKSGYVGLRSNYVKAVNEISQMEPILKAKLLDMYNDVFDNIKLPSSVYYQTDHI